MCSVLKRAEARATSMRVKSEIKQLYADHIAFTNAEVAVYEKHIFDSQDDPLVCFKCHL